MTEERRLIEDARLDSTTHALLKAGREASPSRASKERLLAAVLPSIGAPTGELGGLEAKIGKGLFGSLKVASLPKVVALSVLGIAAGGTFYATRHADFSGTASSSAVPAAIGVPQGPVEAPAVRHALRDRGNRGPELLAGASGPVIPVVAPRTGAEGPSSSNFLDLAAPRRVLVPTRGARSAALTTGGAAQRPTPRRGVLAVTSTPALEATAPTRAARPESARSNRGAQRELSEPAPLESTPGLKAPAGPSQNALLDTQLVEELRQLDAVRYALRAGNEASARQLLTDYYRHFPSGYLRPEAKRLEAQVGESSPR